MDKNLIKTIIGEKHYEIPLTTLSPRPFSYEGTMCYVNIGIRRAGKSYLLYQDILERIRAGIIRIEDTLYVNFEDERIADINAMDLSLLLECYREMYGPAKPWLYLDEIQNINGWEHFLRRLSESKYRVMVTGSNAKMLSKEISSSLGGSYIAREILPFSWREYLTYHDIKTDPNWEFSPGTRQEIRRRFDDYFYNGGFAESFPLINKREWLSSLYQKILMGDIITRHKIRNDRQIRLLARKVADNVMQPTAISRFEHIIKSSGDVISAPTVKDYLEYMEESYLIFSIPNFASPDSEQETLRKRYFMDNGLLNLFLYKGDTKLLENLVAIHLRRLYWSEEEPKIFFYKRGVDLDFYVPDEKLAIQASYSIQDNLTRERETNAIVVFNKVFKLNRAIIITYDEEETILKEGITIEVIPIWKWLLHS